MLPGPWIWWTLTEICSRPYTYKHFVIFHIFLFACVGNIIIKITIPGMSSMKFLKAMKNNLFSLIRFHIEPPIKMQFAKTQPVWYFLQLNSLFKFQIFICLINNPVDFDIFFYLWINSGDWWFHCRQHITAIQQCIQLLICEYCTQRTLQNTTLLPCIHKVPWRTEGNTEVKLHAF